MSDFIYVKTSVTDEKCSFLGDSQADISIIKIRAITRNLTYYPDELVYIKGVTSEHISSIGTIIFDIIIENVAIAHKFHLVHDDFAIPSNGILGKDFIKKHKCVLDYDSMTFEVRLNSITVSTPIYTDILENKTFAPPRSDIFKLFKINNSGTFSSRN